MMEPTLRTCFDTFWYFYDKPASQVVTRKHGQKLLKSILNLILSILYPTLQYLRQLSGLDFSA